MLTYCRLLSCHRTQIRRTQGVLCQPGKRARPVRRHKAADKRVAREEPCLGARATPLCALAQPRCERRMTVATVGSGAGPAGLAGPARQRTVPYAASALRLAAVPVSSHAFQHCPVVLQRELAKPQHTCARAWRSAATCRASARCSSTWKPSPTSTYTREVSGTSASTSTPAPSSVCTRKHAAPWGTENPRQVI